MCKCIAAILWIKILNCTKPCPMAIYLFWYKYSALNEGKCQDSIEWSSSQLESTDTSLII